MRAGVIDHRQPAVWAAAAPMLQRALDRDPEHDLEDAMDILTRRHGHLWGVADGERLLSASLWELAKTRKGLVYNCWLFGGSKDGWPALQEAAAAHARGEGAYALGCHGRAGWERELKGWRTVAVEMEYAL